MSPRSLIVRLAERMEQDVASFAPGKNGKLPGGARGSGVVPAEPVMSQTGLEFLQAEVDTRNGIVPPVAYVHGEVWGVGGVRTVPDNPRGERSSSIENRAKGRGEWNVYDVVAVDGVIKLSVNGKFVNGISRSTRKKGYLCLEAEGAEIHFRDMRILELPPGVTTPEQTAPARAAGQRPR